MSHSVSADDRALLEQVEKECGALGVGLYLAEREFAPTTVTQKLRGAIHSSDFVLVLITETGATSQWVNQEIAIANEMAKPIIPLLEEGVEPPGLIAERDQIRFTRTSFSAAFARVSDYIRRNFMHSAEEQAKPLDPTSIAVGVAIGAAIVLTAVVIIYALTRE